MGVNYGPPPAPVTFVYIQNTFSAEPLAIQLDLGTTTVDDLLAMIMAELALPLVYTNRIALTYQGRPVYRRTSTLQAEGIPPQATLVLSSPL